MRRPLALGLSLALAALGPAAPATAFDPETVFERGRIVASVEGGFGEKATIEMFRTQSDIELWNGGVRVGVLPFGATGAGPLRGALEVGLEPYYQRYTKPADAFFGGLAVVARYHFLSLGRVVPWVEVFGAAGGTDLNVPEIRSSFTFLLQGGAGVSVFVSDWTALYAGYRFQHVSNGGTSLPNRGFEAHTGVLGVSYFFH